jgi:hypothetical protein
MKEGKRGEGGERGRIRKSKQKNRGKGKLPKALEAINITVVSVVDPIPMRRKFARRVTFVAFSS